MITNVMGSVQKLGKERDCVTFVNYICKQMVVYICIDKFNYEL